MVLTNQKLKTYEGGLFVLPLSIVVSKYGTDYQDYKEPSIAWYHVRSVFGPWFILLSALWISQNSSDRIYCPRNKSLLFELMNSCGRPCRSGLRSQCSFPGWIWIVHCLPPTFPIKDWSMENATKNSFFFAGALKSTLCVVCYCQARVQVLNLLSQQAPNPDPI